MEMKNVKIKNFKGIKIIDVSTEKNMIVISGPNGAGKSSFCDAIMTTLAGKDKAIKRPIREGESKASVEIELDGYVVRKYFKQGSNPKLSVTPTGKMESLKTPQAWLNAHIGSLKFDPSEFARLKDTDQRDMLMELAGLNLQKEDEKIGLLYADRTILGRELSNIIEPTQESLAEAKEYGEKEEVSVSELSDKYSDESTKTIRLEARKKELFQVEENIKTFEIQKGQLIEAIEADVSMTETELNDLKSQIDNAETTNTRIRNSQAILRSKKRYDEKETEHKAKEDELELARETKKQLIQAAKFPIEGLSVSDDGVLYKGIPFSQVSDSQRIVIGTLIALALMPKDNPIKIIFIKLGSLLDDKAMEYLEKVSLEQDAQIVVEFVGDKKGFHIVEGEIVNQ